MVFWFLGFLDFWIFGFALLILSSDSRLVQKTKKTKIQKPKTHKKPKNPKTPKSKVWIVSFGGDKRPRPRFPKFGFLDFRSFQSLDFWFFGIFLAASRNFQAQGRKFKIAGIHSEATAKAGTIWPSTEACTLTDIATLRLGRPGGPAKPQGCKVCRSPGLSAWTFCPSCGCGF